MRALTALLLATSLAGCSIFFDPDDHLGSDEDVDGGGTMDAGPGTDSGTDGGAPPTDAPGLDSGAPDGGGRTERCAPVADPRLFCPDTVAVTPASIDLGGLVPTDPISIAIVEDGAEGLDVVTSVLDSGSPLLLYNELSDPGIVNTPHTTVDVADIADSFIGVQPTGVRSHAIRRVGPSEIGMTFLSADTGDGLSDVWVAGFVDGEADSIDNLSGGTFPSHGQVALSGGHGGESGARHFWRELAGGGMVLASLPYDDWSESMWRSTQGGVDDTEANVPMRGSDGDFVATTSETAGHLQLWSGLGADADMPTYVDHAAPAIDYTYDGPGNVVQFDFALIDGDRYVLAFAVQNGTNYEIGLASAECTTSCTAFDPEVCSNDCTFGSYTQVNPVGGVDDARVAVAGAGPDAVAVATAARVDGAWTVTLSVLDAEGFARITNPGDVPYLSVVGSFATDLLDLDATSRLAGGTLDVVVSFLDGAGYYDLATFQPCLCD